MIKNKKTNFHLLESCDCVFIKEVKIGLLDQIINKILIKIGLL